MTCEECGNTEALGTTAEGLALCLDCLELTGYAGALTEPAR